MLQIDAQSLDLFHVSFIGLQFAYFSCGGKGGEMGINTTYFK